MNIKHIISLSAITLPLMIGCVDLNYSEVQTNDKEWVYSMTYVTFQVWFPYMYAHVRYDLGAIQRSHESFSHRRIGLCYFHFRYT